MQEILIGNIKGDVGSGLKVLDYFATLEALTSAVTNPISGDAYGVGVSEPYDIYIYSANKGWVNNGALQPDINEQTPNYAEATTLENLTSGEKISIAFGKIKKAIAEFISHLADTTKHITSTERTSWNNKAPSGHGLGTLSVGETGDTFNGTLNKGCGFYRVSSAEDAPNNLPYWFSVFQNLRGLQTDSQPTGTQLSVLDYFDYNSDSPRMWFRTASQGNLSEWVETLHTGNIENYMPRISFGTYDGDGNTSQYIDLGFEPSAVLVYDNGGTQTYVDNVGVRHYYGGLALRGNNCYIHANNQDHKIIQIAENGFSVFSSSYNQNTSGGFVIHANNSGGLFYYIAIK